MEYLMTSRGRLPLVGLGTFSIPPAVLEELIPFALQQGCTLFDTAYKYGNEAVLGNLLANVSEGETPLWVETKICYEQVLGNLRYLRLNRRSVRSCMRLASKKLRCDSLPVLMLHSTFSGDERAFAALLQLKERGQIGLTGICNVKIDDVERLRHATGVYPDIVQCEIHPYHSNQELIRYCQSRGIIVEARSPLAHGDALAEWAAEEVLQRLARKYGKSIVQIVLRWMVQQQVVVLPRTSSLTHLKENLDLFDFGLTKEEMKEIDGVNRNQSYGFFTKRR